ncbi:MAG: hypothetical protein ACREO4_16375 [Lysobacter sp.]
MNQRAFLQQLDADIVGAFAQADMADAAGYLPPAATPDVVPLPCTVLVDRSVEIFGEERPDVATRHTVVTLFRGVVTPVQYGVVTLDATGEAFRLEAKLEEDESQSRWVVADV